MLDRIRVFLRNLPDNDHAAPADDDPRIAAAALLTRVVNADGVRATAETERLRQVLAETYSVTGRELDALLEAGEQADDEAVDLYSFTSVLMRHLDHEARVQFIELMWEIVLADGDIHELEDNTVWRVAELLGIETRDRITARQRVQARQAVDNEAAREE